MEDHRQLDRVRAWVTGSLDEGERAAFEAELGEDAELRAFAESYREVHAATADCDAGLPEPALTFAALEARLDAEERPANPGGFFRRLAVAAALLIAAGAVWQLLRTEDSAPEAPVNLRTIPLASSEPAESIALPATLASFEPVSEGRIQWVAENDEAARIASATGRPMLVFGRYSKCRVADEVEETLAEDLELLALAEQCVPVVVDLEDLDEAEREALIADGYPGIQLRSADGQAVVGLTKSDSDCDIADRMREGLGACGVSVECAPWPVVRDLAALYERAQKAEAEQRFSEAHRFYEELVAGGGNGLLAEAGQRGLVRIALAARDALLDARSRWDNDHEAAERDLAKAVRRFDATPHVAELALVLESVRRTGKFPSIAWATL